MKNDILVSDFMVTSEYIAKRMIFMNDTFVDQVKSTKKK